MIPNPLISIIIPCYNDGKYIHECLNSVRRQTYKDYEIIIINDGSDDKETTGILNKIDYPQITILHTTNQGPAEARNHGIKHSKGKYILPLDADDMVGKQYVSEAIKILEENFQIKIVNCNMKLFGAKKGQIIFDSFSIEKLLCRNIIGGPSIFRRIDFDQTKGYNPNMKEGLEDWDFWLSILENGGEVYKIDKPEIYYRIKKESRNSSITPEEFKKLRCQIYQNHKELYSKHFFDPLQSFEYELILKSKEYKLGKFLLSPIRKIYHLFR